MFSRLRHWSLHLLARLPSALPSSCALCAGAATDGVCSGCRQQFFGKRQARCRQCAIILPLPDAAETSATVCGDCLQRAPAFDATIVAADYAAPVDQLVLALKFGNQLPLAPLFGHMLRDALLLAQAESVALPDLLTAVPLGPQRLAQRGFNQALEIARPLSGALGIALVPGLVVRARDTSAQALLHPDERHKNIRNAFVVPGDAIDAVRGRHIGVVDDVLTTGETLNELAATLKRFGAARVTNFVFARTPPRK